LSSCTTGGFLRRAQLHEVSSLVSYISLSFQLIFLQKSRGEADVWLAHALSAPMNRYVPSVRKEDENFIFVRVSVIMELWVLFFPADSE
jgi:hypothetical protein